MHGRFIHNATANQDVHLCMSERHTLSIITQHLTHKENDLCLENKDTIAYHHSSTHSKGTHSDAHFLNVETC